MLITVQTPTGMDAIIYDVQNVLHDALLSRWAIDSGQYLSYGRCYRNKKGNGYVAEVYQGGNEYKEVYWDDSVSAISFFGIGNTITNGNRQTLPVHLVVFANLEKLKPTNTNRADEDLRWDFLNILKDSVHGQSVKSTVLGIENVLQEYPGSYRDERLKTVDMHPVHSFRIDLELTYDNNNSCTISNTF